MAKDSGMHIGENSPEYVAFRLLREVAYAEDKNMFDGPGGSKPDRTWILDTYAECLAAASGKRTIPVVVELGIPRAGS